MAITIVATLEHNHFVLTGRPTRTSWAISRSSGTSKLIMGTVTLLVHNITAIINGLKFSLPYYHTRTSFLMQPGLPGPPGDPGQNGGNGNNGKDGDIGPEVRILV